MASSAAVADCEAKSPRANATVGLMNFYIVPPLGGVEDVGEKGGRNRKVSVTEMVVLMPKKKWEYST